MITAGKNRCHGDWPKEATNSRRDLNPPVARTSFVQAFKLEDDGVPPFIGRVETTAISGLPLAQSK